KDRTLPKPFNIRPGYDFKYVTSYIEYYLAFDEKQYDKLFDNEKLFNNLSIIKQNETLVQWGIRVRVPLQNLLSAGKFNVYH
ncbi:9603_t:CDS:1, partial [Diversispora eburnea]